MFTELACDGRENQLLDALLGGQVPVQEAHHREGQRVQRGKFQREDFTRLEQLGDKFHVRVHL